MENRMNRMNISFGMLLGVYCFWPALGCSYTTTYVEETDAEFGNELSPPQVVDCDAGDEECMGKRVVASSLRGLTTSTNALGSFFSTAGVTNQTSGMETNELEPGEYTLQFGVQPPADGHGFATYAVINWKIAGQQQQRIMSIYQGASISGVAEGVSVQLFDQSGDASVSRQAPYNIIITLSRGTRANTQQPPVLVTTSNLIIPHGLGTKNETVPNNAGVISVSVSAANNGVLANTDLAVFEINSAGTLGAFYPNIAIGWNPLVPGSTILTLTNNSTTTDAVLSLIWGIEG
jgi:hypothetical protein